MSGLDLAIVIVFLIAVISGILFIVTFNDNNVNWTLMGSFIVFLALGFFLRRIQ